MRRFLTVVVATTMAVGSLAGASAWPGPGEPTAADSTEPQIRPRLRGVPLRPPTRLQLLAETAVLDVDRDTRRVIEGLPSDPETRWAERANGHLVITDDCLDCVDRPTVYVVRRGRYVADRIATGVFVTPGRRGLWAKSYDTPTSCTLGQISITGRTLRPARPIGCPIDVFEESALGLVVSVGDGWALLDPSDLHVITHGKAHARAHAVAGRRLLVRDEKGFALVDLRTGAETRIADPSAVGHPGRGSLSPDGRFIAIEYRDPTQFMDLWILELDTARWIHAPSMPVQALIKRDYPSWTPDGRLLVLGYFGARTDPRHLLVVWRPGRPRLAIRPMTEDAWFVL